MQDSFGDIKNNSYPSSNEWEYDDTSEEVLQREEIDSLEVYNIFIEEAVPKPDSLE